MLALLASAIALAAANVPPSAENAFPYVSWREDVPLEFDATPSSDPDGRIVLFEWDLDGDGTFEQRGATLTKPRHTYTEPGLLTAWLRVTDDAGASVTAPIQVEIAATDTVRILSAPRAVTRRQLRAGVAVAAERNNAGIGRIINVNVMCGKGRKRASVASGWVETPAGDGFMRGDITVRPSFHSQRRALARLRKPRGCTWRFESNGALAKRRVTVRP
jgi:hypothetical protein